MKLINYIYILLSTACPIFANCNCSLNYDSENISQITQYEIKIPSYFDEHTIGFPSGIGSSMTLKGITKEGNIEFYTITDRGPNYTIHSTNHEKHTIVFPRPDYSPFIGIVSVIPGQSATLTDVIPLKINGQAINGLSIPRPNGDINSSIPTDLSFKRLSVSPKGFDTESIDIDAEGNFWIGDEYRPSLIKVQGTSGEIIKILTPGNGLPEILENGPSNRGFEALAVAPNGKIYAAMESILDFQDATKNSANFIRIIELDPKTHQTRTFAYPYDKSEYKHPLTAKIGDLAAIDDTHFLIVEQGKTCKGKGMRNIIYIIDIANATDISEITLPDGRPIEYASLDELSNIQFIRKSFIMNAVDHLWSHEKLEGLAIVDSKTIAISNDNDFGFSLSINGVNSEKVTGYNVDYEKQQLLKDKKQTSDKTDVHIDKNAHTNIWFIKFKKDLLDFMETSKN